LAAFSRESSSGIISSLLFIEC